MLALLADGKPPVDLGLVSQGYPGGDVLGGSGGEVDGSLGEARPPWPWIRRMRLVHRDRVAVLGDNARPHLVQRIATLAASGL